MSTAMNNDPLVRLLLSDSQIHKEPAMERIRNKTYEARHKVGLASRSMRRVLPLTQQWNESGQEMDCTGREGRKLTERCITDLLDKQ